MFPAVEEAACGYPEQPLGSLVTVDFFIFMIFMMIIGMNMMMVRTMMIIINYTVHSDL